MSEPHTKKAMSWLGPLVLAAVSVVACAAPAPIEGAPCPCPKNFFCDKVTATCVAGAPVEMNNDPKPDPQEGPMPPPPGSCTEVGPGPRTSLTPTEYRFAIKDLVGLELRPDEVLPEVDGPTGFATSSGEEVPVEGLRALAGTVAMKAKDKLGRPAFCPATLADEPCGQRFAETLAKRAFRRPLEAADRTKISNGFAIGFRAGAGFVGGMTAAFQVILASDNFLRRRDLTLDGQPRANVALPLDAWSLAARLSTLIWRSVPDESLLAAAESGALLKADELERQAERMLSDPRAERMWVSFFRDWLDVDEMHLMTVADNSPMVPSGFVPALLRSFDAFASELVFRRNADLATLYTSGELFGDRMFAAFYGLNPPTGSDYGAVAPGAGQIRHGIITTPAFLAARSLDIFTRPVVRATKLLERLFCVELPEPPPLAAIPPNTDPGLTTRERYEQHRSNPACAACHSWIDPTGLALENYDGLGRWRTTEGKATVDPSGMIPAVGDLPSITVKGPADLGDALAKEHGAAACFVRQFVRYAWGRMEGKSTSDTCLRAPLEKAFMTPAARPRDLVLAITRTVGFTAMNVSPTR
jgi:Protein of unknown function (DUF1588)/Protein of unknown function (DUF1592)/Protein of unknown function (DUF1595)/Protein of unknown function (DUF1585)